MWLVQIIVTAIIVKDAMKMGNIVSRAEIEPTSLAFQASVLTIKPPRLHDVTTVPTPTCLCSFLRRD